MAVVVKRIPVGTNLGLVHLMWAMLNGSFLTSRGSIFSALSASGLSDKELRRSWQAFGKGQWSITRLLKAWREHVFEEKQWKGHSYEGYRVLSVDITSFYRPKLRSWIGKLYQGIAGKALKAVGIGIIADVGRVGNQRIAIPRKLLRSKNEKGSEKTLQQTMLKWLSEHQAIDEVSIYDAGFSLKDLQQEGIKQFVIRLASNCTVRRNTLPTYKGKGARPQYGERIRPSARSYKGKTITASPFDKQGSFQFQERTISFHSWHDVLRSDQKVSDTQETLNIFTFFDPLYKDPLVLATPMSLLAKSVFLFYRDRWPVEQLPLASKQLLGCKRAFVHNSETIFRLPELALLTGNILTYLAATSPTIPSGFWDRKPKKHQVAFVGL